MAKFTKQPAKIGDFIAAKETNPALFTHTGFSPNKAYKVVATQNSKEHNRIVFGEVYPMWDIEEFGVFVLDDNGSKRFMRINTVTMFGFTWEKVSA